MGRKSGLISAGELALTDALTTLRARKEARGGKSWELRGDSTDDILPNINLSVNLSLCDLSAFFLFI